MQTRKTGRTPEEISTGIVLIIGIFIIATGFCLALIYTGGQTRAGIIAPAIGRTMFYAYAAAGLLTYIAPLSRYMVTAALWIVPAALIIAVSYYIGGNDHLVEMAVFSWSRVISGALFSFSFGVVIRPFMDVVQSKS